VRLALDSDVLIAWTMPGALRHSDAVALLERERGANPALRLALVPQVAFEFLRVATDPRRFERPLTMEAALQRVEALWSASDVERVPVDPVVVGRTAALMRAHGLGRKRILDTALAATLESAGVRRLATFNGADYAAFPFLDVVGT
jgi:predicted nucleic acid-binding protein